MDLVRGIQTAAMFQIPVAASIGVSIAASINARSVISTKFCCFNSATAARSSNLRSHPLRAIVPAKMAPAGAASDTKTIYFGPWKLDVREIFYKTDLSIALVNTKPLVPDVLVMSRRVVPRFQDLTAGEVSDMWLTAQLVGKKVETHFNASSLTFAIQDGKAAGQTVAHVHIHILPRRVGDFEKNDEVYDAIDANSKENAAARNGGAKPLDLDKERKARTIDEMAAEAATLSSLFGCE